MISTFSIGRWVPCDKNCEILLCLVHYIKSTTYTLYEFSPKISDAFSECRFANRLPRHLASLARPSCIHPFASWHNPMPYPFSHFFREYSTRRELRSQSLELAHPFDSRVSVWQSYVERYNRCDSSNLHSPRATIVRTIVANWVLGYRKAANEFHSSFVDGLKSF